MVKHLALNQTKRDRYLPLSPVLLQLMSVLSFSRLKMTDKYQPLGVLYLKVMTRPNSGGVIQWQNIWLLTSPPWFDSTYPYQFCPISSKVEPTTDNRKTLDRYQHWAPSFETMRAGCNLLALVVRCIGWHWTT